MKVSYMNCINLCYLYLMKYYVFFMAKIGNIVLLKL